MKTTQQKLDAALQLLGDILIQDFVSEIAWESKQMRAWIRKTEKLLNSDGYAKTVAGMKIQ